MEKLRNDHGFAALLLAAAIVTFLLMTAGNAVRVTGAAQACPDWPTCYGQWRLPPGSANFEPAAIQFAHRGLALMSALLVAASAAWAMRAVRLQEAFSSAARWVILPLLASAGLLLSQVALGARLVLLPGSALNSALHMAAALVTLALVTASAVALFYLRARPARSKRLAYRSPFARLARLGLLAVFLLLLSGTLVSVTGAAGACQGWPLCGGLPAGGLAWLALVHRVVALAVGALLAVQFVLAWRGQRSQLVLLPAASGAFLFMLGQVAIGAVNVTRGFPTGLVALHAAAAAGLWVVQAALALAAGFEARTAAEELAESREPLPLGRRARDFFILSKPIIVALLLVTTYAGMVVGGRALPEAGLVFWTLLGGALAAGGSSALNQYIDRETDKAMQRTAMRPLPDGRLRPAEGLAYGLSACLAAFFILAGAVNLLAAVLSLAGMIYYVLIYSVWLKHATVQNIVIGGGAGAIPPLVGWAAAVGSLNVPAFFLFAIIFMWTPPHFWALALVRRKDYARGRVPMLPVVRGEMETRKQILYYTLALVALTLALPLLQMAGLAYLVIAALLGLWLIHTAWRVYTEGGNKLAWKMYRYSSMYLAFLMLAMVFDALL